MIDSGVDLSKPIEVEFTLDVADEDMGSKLQDELKAAGYLVELEYEPGELEEDEAVVDEGVLEEFGPSWTLYARVQIVPTYEEIMARQENIGRLASKYGSTCDGWGAMLSSDARRPCGSGMFR